MKYVVQPWERSETIDLLTTRFGVTADELLQANPILQSVPP
jgi:hypothetical protein